ncbi:MAG: MobV family relaxase [Janthinobacterium lividum]
MRNPLRIGDALLLAMSYAILRLSKLKNLGMATSATQHNYRLQDTPNANPEWAVLNEEHLNHGHRNYWHLANERIAELHLVRLRSDAVRAVELVLTGSPEAFPRDADGRALDRRGTPWVQDNLQFVRERFGAKNVVSFTLHQDEVTPHIHAVVVPITADGRLSSRDVFSPVSLRQLQTDYAEAMAPHGLERGIKYSTAIHEDVRRHYGAQQMSKEALAEVAAPAIITTLRLEEPTAWDRVNLRGYLDRQQALMDAFLAEQMQGVNRQLDKVATVATANTLAHDRARVLEQQLARAKDNLAKVHEKLAAEEAKVAALQKLEAGKTQALNRLAVTFVQGQPLDKYLLGPGQRLREKSRQDIEQALSKQLVLPWRGAEELKVALQALGYDLVLRGPTELTVLDSKTGAKFGYADIRPDGRDFAQQVQAAVARSVVQQQKMALSQKSKSGCKIKI